MHLLPFVWAAMSQFTCRPFMYNITFLIKSLKFTSFGTLFVQNGQLFEAQWDFKLSEEFEIDVIFLWKQRFYRFHTFFTYSLCLEKLTNFNAKGAKRSVKMWATNFCKSFFKNILLYMNGRLSKICSVHTYDIPRIWIESVF